jgi:probable F420-dependent oxidoreductase
MPVKLLIVAAEVVVVVVVARLAGERTEGAHPYFVPPEHTARTRKILGDGPLLCPEQAVVLEPDPARARAVARAHTSVYLGQPNYVNNIRELGFAAEDLAPHGGTDAFVDALVAWGGVDAVLARVREHLDAGADHVAVQVLTAEKRGVPEAQWRELAAPLAELAAGDRRHIEPERSGYPPA